MKKTTHTIEIQRNNELFRATQSDQIISSLLFKNNDKNNRDFYFYLISRRK